MSASSRSIEAGFIDWIVSTGANLYHDTHYALGMDLHQAGRTCRLGTAREPGHPHLRHRLRLREPARHGHLLPQLIRGEAFQQTMGTAEFHHLVGKYLHGEREAAGRPRGKSLLAAAYRGGVPIYTSAPATARSA
jgi:deoxyhypusine synthase